MLESAKMMPELSHPLARFAVNGAVIESSEADMVLRSIQAAVLADPTRGQCARFFLLEGEAFFETCRLAGIDAHKLRRHLRRVLDRREQPARLLFTGGALE